MGLSTTIKDIHGNMIHEGDFVKAQRGDEKPYFGTVTWDNEEIVGYRVVYFDRGLKYETYLCGWYQYEIVKDRNVNEDVE